MRVQSNRVLLRPIWVAAFALGVLLPLLGLTAHAQAAAPTAAVQQQPAAPADHGGGNGHRADFRGKIDSLPATNDLVGEWKVAGKTYAVTSDTEIKQRYLPAAVGVCVAGELADDNTTVREVMTLPAWACTKPSDGGGDNGGNNAVGGGELYAKITSMPTPAGQLTGTWVIGTLTFSATETTTFNQENGPFAADTYVRVKFYILPDGTFVATEIRTAIKPDTGGDDDHHGDHGGHGGHGHHEGEEGKAFGVVEITPTDEITGIWQISGITYSVSYTTELDSRRPITVGSNVKVEYYLDADSNRVATEIKGMPATAGPKGFFRMVGTVDMTPTEGFIGDWVIDGVPFVADSTSIFSETHGILAVDAFVKVTYIITDVGGSTQRLIKTIETVRIPGSGDHDHCGRVERMDDGRADASSSDAAVATWQVGGQTYVVNDATQIDSKLTANSLAVVNSYTAADGSLVATRISAADALYLPALSK